MRMVSPAFSDGFRASKLPYIDLPQQLKPTPDAAAGAVKYIQVFKASVSKDRMKSVLLLSHDRESITR